MSDSTFSCEPVSEGMMYGPPCPPDFYTERESFDLSLENYPDRNMAELIMEEADGDLGYYNLMMLRAQLLADRVRNKVAEPVFNQNYLRLCKAIGEYNFQRATEILDQNRPLPPTGRKRK